MKRLLLAVGVCLAVPAVADPPQIKNSYGFDVMKPKTKCVKVAGAVVTKLAKQYTCAAPADPTASASGKPMLAECPAKKGTSRYLLFAAQKDCNEERETQLANGE